MEQQSIYEQMKSLLESIQPDVDKFYQKGTKSSGTKIRKAMQELKALAQDQRAQISEMSKK